MTPGNGQLKEDIKRLKLVKALIERIDGSSKNIVNRLSRGVSVDNLDEIRAALRNEINRFNKSLTSLFKQISSLPSKDGNVLKEIQSNLKSIKDQDKAVDIKNISDISFPESLSIDNLSSLKPLFDSISKTIKESFNIKIPEPNIDIKPPIVNVPETKINIPDIDLSPLIRTIKTSLNRLSSNNVTRPLAVRLTDGQEWIKQIKSLSDNQKIAFQGFSDNFRLRGKTGGVINPSTEEGLTTINTTLTGGIDVNIQDGGGTDLTSTTIGSDQALDVNVVQTTGGGGGTQYADGDVRGTATGTISMVDDGTNIQSMKGDSSGRPEVTVNGSVAVTGTFWQAIQPVSATQLDIDDLAFGTDTITVYGSQSSALQQKITSNDLIVTLDGETIDVGGTVTANLGTIADVSTETTLSALNTKFNTGTVIGDVNIVETSFDATQATAANLNATVVGTGTFAVQESGDALTALQVIDNFISGSRGLVTEDNSAAILSDTSIMSGWDNIASDGASVSGDVVHDGVDAGEPVKVGAKAIDYEPDESNKFSGNQATDTHAPVAHDDRVNISTNLYGEQIEGVNGFYFTLDNVSTIYDTETTETQTSTAVECWNYRKAAIGFDLTLTQGAPTDILFEVEVSLDGTNYFKLMNNFLGDWRYDDTSAGDSPSECLEFDIACHSIRLKVTGTGLSAIKRFTVSNATLYLRN